MGLKQEYSLDGLPVHCRANKKRGLYPYQHVFGRRGLKNPEKAHVTIGRICETPHKQQLKVRLGNLKMGGGDISQWGAVLSFHENAIKA